jgi:hypothetical protein
MALKPLTAQEKKSLYLLLAGSALLLGLVFGALFIAARP